MLHISKLPRFLIIWVFPLVIALVSWRFMVGGVEEMMEHMLYHALERPLSFYLHVGFAPVALAILPFQFWSDLRMRRPFIHRWLGRLYAVAILLSGTGGLVMALGTQAGQVAAWGFGLLAVIWLCVTANAVWFATQGQFAQHRVWMMRSAALTFAAVTLRLYLPFLAMSFGFETGYSLVSWLCWVPNLLIIEWIIRRRAKPLAA
ncbi:DUF2306 domain-containing protein [Cognatishimia sp. WU-CL00825]|uniref:DUF2306 domain-containing protein n=1 Tax=Cognatishimia sp. WU-CL00825 TaxID=3127658 RepID=UPI0033658363